MSNEVKQELQRLHALAVSEVAAQLGKGAGASVRHSHILVQQQHGKYRPPSKAPRHPRFDELPASIQAALLDSERQTEIQFRENHKAGLVGLYMTSGVSRSTATALVDLIAKF